MKRTVFYARVSTDSDVQLHSLSQQRDFFMDYIKNYSQYIYCGEYIDESLSGASMKKRTSFNKMINDALNHQFDLILVKDISRFSRNTLDTIKQTRKLKKAGIDVIFINDHIDTSHSDSEINLTLMAAIAQEESRKNSHRVNWAVQRNFEKGVVHGSMPFGYRRNKNKEMIIFEPEAKIVREIFHLYLNGLGCRTIRKKLCEDEKIKPIVENWDDSRIVRMIKNPKYCGDLVQGLSYTDDFLSKSRKLQDDPSKIYYKENHHEGIITKRCSHIEIQWINDINENMSMFTDIFHPFYRNVKIHIYIYQWNIQCLKVLKVYHYSRYNPAK